MGIDGRIVFKRVLKLWVVGLDWIDLAPDRGRCRARECSDELPGSIKCGEILD